MRKLRSMKSLKEIILMFAVVISVALSVPAQNDDQKQRPPKEKPPVVDPVKKPPKGTDRPKKPGMSFYAVSAEVTNNLG